MDGRVVELWTLSTSPVNDGPYDQLAVLVVVDGWTDRQTVEDYHATGSSILADGVSARLTLRIR